MQRGLSLIELMISITIGLLILVSLSTMFVNQSKTRSELDKSNRMIDNGRYALEVLSDNLRMAGYYGEFEPTSSVPAVPAMLPDPCSTDAAAVSASLQLAVQGYDAAVQASQISGLPPLCNFTYSGGSDSSLKPGSDILAIRRASTATPIVQGAAMPNTLYLQVSLCQFDVAPYIVSSNPAAFTLRTTGCTPASVAPYANLRNFMVHVYFVSPNNNTSPADGIPTLKRYEYDPTTNSFVVRPLVEGIEYMQIDYGLDSNNDGAPDTYVTAPAVAQWPNVVSVKMNILARNTESTQGYTDTKTYTLGTATFGPFNDSFKRHVYTQYILLVNPAGRRS